MEKIVTLKLTPNEIKTLTQAGNIISDMCDLSGMSRSNKSCNNCEFKGLCVLGVSHTITDLRVQVETEFEVGLITEEEQ